MKFKNQFSIFFVLMIIWILINNSFDPEIFGVGAILSIVLAIVFGRRMDVLNDFKFTPKAFYYVTIYVLSFFV